MIPSSVLALLEEQNEEVSFLLNRLLRPAAFVVNLGLAWTRYFKNACLSIENHILKPFYFPYIVDSQPEIGNRIKSRKLFKICVRVYLSRSPLSLQNK